MSTVALPKYEKVKRQLVAEIQAGRWAVGSAFPSEAQLLGRYKVSRPTLVRSLQEMVREGYLTREQGRGTFVADFRSKQDTAQPIPLFISAQVARLSGDARLVLVRMLAGLEQQLDHTHPGLTVRQVQGNTLDADTRRWLDEQQPRIGIMIEPDFNPELWQAVRERCDEAWAVNQPVNDGHCVYIDQQQAGYLAARHLIRQGCRRVALINGPAADYWGFAARRDGYRQALREAGLPIDDTLEVEAAHAIDSEAGRDAMRQLIGSDTRFDGVVAASDAKAIGARSAAGEADFVVPDDFRIVSIDNTIAPHAAPPLAAVAMPFEEVGRQVALHLGRTITDLGSRGPDARVQTTVRVCLRPNLVTHDDTDQPDQLSAKLTSA